MIRGDALNADESLLEMSTGRVSVAPEAAKESRDACTTSLKLPTLRMGMEGYPRHVFVFVAAYLLA